ncbi:MAG TPA: T9SS type A sorting domain-containing protein [bacterium]|nr:T9SS type A sorting domain-containing protein [bacterium]HQJ66566.1 T9SS type A sorting domain-containing protein [bacterium]
MKKLTLAVFIALILPHSALTQSSHLLSAKDYFPPTPGNIWVTQIAFDRGSHNFYALKVLEQFTDDSARFYVGSGPSDKYNMNDPMDFSLNCWEIRFESSQLIRYGAYRNPEQPFLFLSECLDLSDNTKFISLDSTIMRPAGTFHHCIVERDGDIWAPGFGPVPANLVYAKVNGVEYGRRPRREAAPRHDTLFDFFPSTPGNIWVTKYREDHGAGNYWGLKIFQQYRDDSLVYHLGSGPSDPTGLGLPMTFSFTHFTLKFQPAIKIMEGVFSSLDSGIPFYPVSTWLDLSNLVALDSTITCSIGTFYHCIIDQRGRAFAPGFGPVSANLVYAKVNGVEYGTMPNPSAAVSDRPQNTPRENFLYSAYPNPFNQSAGISFYLNKPGLAKLTIFDTQGRTVRVLLDEHAASGSHYLTWDGMSDDRLPCPSGVYFISLKSSEFFQKRALTLVR